MGMKITLEQNAMAVTECADSINDKFYGSGVVADIVQHSNAKKYSGDSATMTTAKCDGKR